MIFALISNAGTIFARSIPIADLADEIRKAASVGVIVHAIPDADVDKALEDALSVASTADRIRLGALPSEVGLSRGQVRRRRKAIAKSDAATRSDAPARRGGPSGTFTPLSPGERDEQRAWLDEYRGALGRAWGGDLTWGQIERLARLPKGTLGQARSQMCRRLTWAPAHKLGVALDIVLEAQQTLPDWGRGAAMPEVARSGAMVGHRLPLVEALTARVEGSPLDSEEAIRIARELDS